MKYDVLKIENQLCFPLYVCSKEIVRKYKPFLDKIGLTYTQYITMLVLWENEEMTINQIGDILYLDSGTLTPLLKKLERANLISKTRKNSDERTIIVKLTNKGKHLQEQAKSIPVQIGSCLNLKKEETKELYTILYKIIKNIE